VLNFIFSSLNLSRESQLFFKNKNILKKLNLSIYSAISLLYSILTIFIYPFQRRFINLYTALLQLNRLPFRIIPDLIKIILIYFVDIQSWILFFKRIKNHNNLYITREKNYRYLHRLWCVYFRNASIYYSELNIKRLKSKTISNFFYMTRQKNKFTKKVTKSKYKYILFYYINKIALTNYPYFYWTYMFSYNRYNYNTKDTDTSQNKKTHIFFILYNKKNRSCKWSLEKMG